MLDGKEKVGAGFVLDVALGLLACATGCGHDDWAVRARDARRRADWAWLRDDVDGCRSALVESALYDGLACVSDGDEIMSTCMCLMDEVDAGWVADSAWACPDCSDPCGDDEVHLSYEGDGVWVCPRCGCHTTSPADDGAWLVDGCSWCVSAVSDARGLDNSGLLERSAGEWTAVEDCYEKGDYDGTLRHSVMAELIDCVMMGRPVSEWPDRVATMVDDTVGFYKGCRRVCSLACGSSCYECVMSGLAHMGGGSDVA